ncbi:CinA family protein, partial [Arthrospira platensis SPKY1]|nr:CinA family protein [Arthrospira platensis SPKY1]
LSEATGKLLSEKGLTVSTAESCTGGFLAHKITETPGSSSYYKGSIISYSNELKRQLLDVSELTLKEYGAVSEQTVREMVAGLLEKTGTDIAVSVSGIAGPDGG